MYTYPMDNLLKIESLKAELRGEFDYSDVLDDISIEFEDIKMLAAVKQFWLTVNLDLTNSRFAG